MNYVDQLAVFQEIDVTSPGVDSSVLTVTVSPSLAASKNCCPCHCILLLFGELGEREIARLDHEGGGGFVKLNRVTSRVIVEAHCGACASVELRLCYDVFDEHAPAQQRLLLLSALYQPGDLGMPVDLSRLQRSTATKITKIDVTSQNELLRDG